MALKGHMMQNSTRHQDYYLDYLWHAWGGSLFIHLIFLLLAILQYQYWQQPVGIVGTSIPVREAGIYVKNPANGEDQLASGSVDTQLKTTDNNPVVADTTDSSSTPEISTSTLPIELSLPDARSLPTIGIGSTDTQSSPSQQMESISALPNSGRPTSAAAIPAGTIEFFNVKATGRSFIFVIDMSDSMYEYSAFKVAKREVLSNLDQLQPDQQFQLMFYNDLLLEMPNHQGRKELSFANPLNLNLARNFVQERQPTGGTEHFPALSKALIYGAEVVYFLTDAAEPELSAKQLDTLKRLNNGRASIHCIQFSKGPELSSDNFLKKLATQNNGTYRYRDVTRFVNLRD